MSGNHGAAGIFGVMFMVSLAVNLVMGLMLGGCKWLNEDPPVRGDASLDHLQSVARRLGVAVRQDAEAVDIATAIRIGLDESEVSVPPVLPENASKTSMAVLGKDEKALFLKQKAFLDSLQGKRVIVLPR